MALLYFLSTAHTAGLMHNALKELTDPYILDVGCGTGRLTTEVSTLITLCVSRSYLHPYIPVGHMGDKL